RISPQPKTAQLKLLVFSKEVKHEDTGLVHIDARSGDVTQTSVLDGQTAGLTGRHCESALALARAPAEDIEPQPIHGRTAGRRFESALALARAHGEDIEPQPIQEPNGGRIFRLKRKGDCLTSKTRMASVLVATVAVLALMILATAIAEASYIDTADTPPAVT